MKVHLLDGTYELFRNFFGAPKAQTSDGQEVGAARGLLRSLLSLLKQPDVTHVAYAFDHVITSFRNQLFDGYKDDTGIDPRITSQFQLAEDAVAAVGVVVWPMIEFEADDALATAAANFGADAHVEQVLLCTPDKDLAQCVEGERIVMWDRRREILYHRDAVIEKFGVEPASIPDFLALVGDTADGIPGIPKWGERSASTILRRYQTLEDIPTDVSQWDVKIRGAAGLSEQLRNHWKEALLYRQLATLRRDVPLTQTLSDLEWQGADPQAFQEICERLETPTLSKQVTRWRT